MTKKILGISAFYHDSAAALLVNNEVVAAAAEERFTRIKQTSDFPVNAIKYCLETTGLSLNELDSVIFYDKPLLKFERLLETYYAFAPRGLIQFIKSIPVWINEKMFLKKLIFDGLKSVEKYNRKEINLLFSNHHLSHAAGAFYRSPFHESAILTIDGVGEWATATVSVGTKNGIKILKELKFPHSVGLLYSSFTYYLGFRVNSGEYKLMGLAPYGNSKANQTENFIKIIKTHLVSIKDDGSIWLNQSYFNYSTGLTMVKTKKWNKLFGFPPLEADGKIEQIHCNLAYAIQKVTEEIVIKMALEAKKITKSDNLCMSGGVALNCVANGALWKKGIFKQIFIQPAAGDAGGALGAALAANYIYHEQKSKLKNSSKNVYLGPDYSDKEILIALKKHKAVYNYCESFSELSAEVASLIAKGNIVGWFQDRMEWGPRSLGNRSILADPRNKEMQKKLNLKIKYREGFRPFAPSVLSEDTKDFFDLDFDSPYMLFTADLIKKRRNNLPKKYEDLDLYDRLYFERSDVPAITHLDFSARIQTVHKEMNSKFWNLINNFKKITDYGMLVNTSFNVRGEPIVCSPEDAYKCFMRTEMDYLVVNNFLLKKTEQIDWQQTEKWMTKFKMD